MGCCMYYLFFNECVFVSYYFVICSFVCCYIQPVISKGDSWVRYIFYCFSNRIFCKLYAAVNGYRELTLLRGRQRFEAISTSNLEVYKFWDWGIFTKFICKHGESYPSKIWSTENLEQTGVLLFNCFLYLKVNLDLAKTNQLGESSPNFILNLDPIVIEKRWTDGESCLNDFVEKVNRGEDLRWVGSRCPLMHALINT